jgi:hypothetical protein
MKQMFSLMWMALSNQMKLLIEQSLTSPEKEEILPAIGLWT